MSRRWRKPMGWFVVAAFVGAGLAAGWVCHDPGARPYVPIQGAKDGVPRAADVTPRPDVRLAAVDIQAINVLLANTANLRNDVLFLVIAAARDRCAPAEAGSLARMANRAQLPVLSGVSQATAPPSVQAPRSDHYAARQSSSGATDPAQANWQAQVLAHLERFKRYPRAAQRRRSEGVSLVEYAVDRTGSVQWARLVRSSGNKALDGEAVAAVQRASPLPAPPDDVQGDPVNITTPVEFLFR